MIQLNDSETELPRPDTDVDLQMRIRRQDGENFMHLFYRLHAPLVPYYKSWTYKEPIILTSSRDQELREMNRVLSKACTYYAEHYLDYIDLIPYEDKVLDVLSYASIRPFQMGTARPDYIIDENGSLLICEITARFFGNGYFLSFFNETDGQEKAESALITDRHSYFEQMLSYFADMRNGRDKVCVLMSADKSDSIGLYVPFYHSLGMETVIIPAEDVENRLPELDGSMVISALNQFDLLKYSPDTLRFLAEKGMINDFRTIFLLHDKRFFRLFLDPRFTDPALSKEETAFLNQHTIPTYLPDQDSAMFDYARHHKDSFILKHHCLGKSIGVYAGCLVQEKEWEQLFDEGNIKKMILQPFIRQRAFEMKWRTGSGQSRQVRDYVSGTILNVDGCYFGTGLFRTSSRPVINQTDAHKMSPIITDQSKDLPNAFLL